MTDEGPQSRSPQREEIDIKELIPEEWHASEVWVSCYRAYCLPVEALLQTEPFELLGVRGRFFWGGAPFWQSTRLMEPQQDGGLVVRIEVGGVQHALDGPYLMLITTTERATSPRGEEDTRSLLRSVLAILRLALGRNAAADFLGELTFQPSTSEVTAMEPGFRLPTVDGPPDLSPDRLHLLADLHGALDGLSGKDRNRVELSLQWFFKAQAEYGVNAFLMYWFTLEALAMPGRATLAAMEDRLAGIYGLGVKVLRAQFRLGRLYGLRGDIVHNGAHPAIDDRALSFMSAVYWDLFLDQVGLRAQLTAGRFLAEHLIDEWFPVTRRTR